MAAALLALFALNLFWGSVALSRRRSWRAAGPRPDALTANILYQLRLPRAVMVVLLGAALSAAGYLLQTFFANPIAGPFVMGISSGAKLAVALTMVVFLNRGLLTNSWTLILAAFAGAMAAMLFVAGCGAPRAADEVFVVICGVMIGYICSAVTDIVVAFAQDSNIVNLHNWSMGSFSGMTWGNVTTAAAIVLPCLGGVPALKPMAALPDGRKLRRQRRCAGAGVFGGAGAAVQFAGGLRHGVCRADILCGIAVPQIGKTNAGQCKTAVCAARLRSGRRGVLPAV